MKKWSPFTPPLTWNGLPWADQSKNRLWRLPIRLQERVSSRLWNQSRQCSGARMRFSSDTTMLGLELRYPELESGGGNMSAAGQAGVDLYVDGAYWSTRWPVQEGPSELIFFENAERRRREFEIYLPLYAEVEVHRILFDDMAEVDAPRPYRTERPIVHYGTSITQGGCASRPGLSCPAILSRALRMDYVNLGFSGLGKGEAVVAEAMSEIDASCYVLDFGANHEHAPGLERVYLPFIQAIRRKRPHHLLLLVTVIPFAAEQWNDELRREQEAKREVVRRAYEARRADGDPAIHLVEGECLLRAAGGEGQVDGIHPNDLGFLSMADALGAKIRSLLSLEDEPDVELGRRTGR